MNQQLKLKLSEVEAVYCDKLNSERADDAHKLAQLESDKKHVRNTFYLI